MVKNRTILHEAQQLANLMEDETYQKLMAGVLERQAEKMRDPQTTLEELHEAHAMVRALNEIDAYCTAVTNAAVVEDRKPD